MRRIYVVGIGAGDPEQLTLQAARVLGELDVILVIDKGAATRELLEVRAQICAAHTRPEHRVIQVADPPRDRAAADYPGAVRDWYGLRAERIAAALLEQTSESERIGILVWGDPALYDSTLRVLDRIHESGLMAFDCEVIPGITSLQTLTARHRVTWTGIGAPVHVTTGRRLRAGMPAELDDVLVMLDGSAAFAELSDPDLDIFWGAYLGMPDEILISGDLQTHKAEILRLRADARARKGWIMDSYLLHRRRGHEPPCQPTAS